MNLRNVAVEIRPFTESDRNQIAALWETVFDYREPRNDPNVVIDMKTAFDDELFYVACNGNAVIGTIMAGYDGHRGWIYALAVAPDHRREGLGKKLMKAAEEKLRTLGCQKINMQVIGDNDSAIRFYEACGYKIEDRVSLGKVIDES